MDTFIDETGDLKRLISPVLKVLPNLCLRKLDTPMINIPNPAQGSIEDIMAHLDVLQGITGDNIRRRYCFFVQWSFIGEPDLVDLHRRLSQQLSTRFKRHCCLASYGNGTLLAFILKDDTCKIQDAEIELPDCQVEAVMVTKLTGRREKATTRALMCFSSAAIAAVSDILLDMHPQGATYGLEQLYTITEKLDSCAFVGLVAEVKCIPPDTRDEFQATFWKLKDQLIELRRLRKNLVSSIIIDKANKDQHVQALSSFVDTVLDLEVNVFDRSLCPTGRCSLLQYLEDPRLHQCLTLIMRGNTGVGKTELAKTCGYALSKRYCDNPCLYFATTVDSLRKVQSQLKAGHTLMLDEFEGSSIQLVHADANFMKCLLNPVNPQVLRGRNDDIAMPARLMRIVTCNTESLDEWLTALSSRERDVAALRRRVADLHVTRSLYRSTVNTDNLVDGLLPAKRSVAAAFS